MKKTITWGVTILSILTLVFFVSISLTRWKYADDFVFPVMLQKTTVLSFAYKNYMNWDAKFLMPFFIIWFTAIKFLSFNTLMVLAAFSFIGVSYCLLILVLDFKKLIIGLKERIILTATINIFIFILLYDSLGNLLYWMTASGYIHSMFIGLIWLIKYNRTNKFSTIFYFFTFFVSTMPQNITLGLSMIIFIDILLKENKKQYISLFSIFVFGVLLSTFSPGSLIQLQAMQKTHYAALDQTHNLSSYIVHFFKIYIEALKVNYVLLFLFSLSTILFIRGLAGQSLTKFVFKVDQLFSFQDKSNIKIVLTKYKYFFAAFFCLAVYWPTLLYGYRYYYGFYIFLFLAIINLISTEYRNTIVISTKIYIGFLPVFLIGFIIYGSTMKESIIVSNFIKERNHILLKNSGKSKVDIPSIDFSTFTRSVRATDVGDDANYCTNKYYSEIYNIDTVISTYQLSKEQILNFK